MNVLKKAERIIARIKQTLITSALLHRYNHLRIIKQYQNYTYTPLSIKEAATIWICWWQGEEEMPEVVKVCYQSIKRHAGKHPVQLITDKNMHEFVTFPDYIYAKYHAGIISKTHLSDILRMYLLKQYGGIWMDITNFVTQDIDTFIRTDLPFWTCRHITTYNNVSAGLWTSFFIAACKGHIIPTYIYDSLVHYWSHSNKLMVYLLMDYVFKTGYDRIPAIKKAINNVPMQGIGNMRKILNKKYDPQEFKHYYRQAGFQKLSYKKYTNKQTPKGEKTHFAHLLATFGSKE